MPLVTGVRSVNTPDPNDTFQLSSLIAHTKVTVITSTPTFFKQMLEASHKDQLTTLRLVMTGAEKAPEELLDLMKQKTEKTELLEGYGITECSPIISVGQKPGNVGLPVVGAKILILSQETEQEVKTGEEGMIYVSGPFVFNGYVDPTLESPFQTINGKKFYKTGDIGYLDREGNLHISGRLKRFVKIAGEMISIPAIEEVLQKEYASETLQIALEAKEKADGTATFVVFATKKLETKAINSFLRQEGISNLVKISKVKVIEEIPLL
ncbi:AMP-binding protein [bacterium]|nr:AMP-binding protein [bacterium]